MAAEGNTADAGSVKNAIRWGLLLAAVGTVGFRLPGIVHDYQGWREALRVGDTSGADGWHTILEVNVLASLLVLAMGIAAFYFLRPAQESR